MNFKRVLATISIAYMVFLLYMINVSPFEPDEGTHSLLGVFYLDLFRYAISHPSFSDIYNYAYSYLVYYPKLSVYYPPFIHFLLSGFFVVFGKSYIVARIVIMIFSLCFVWLIFYFSKFLFNEKIGFLSSLFFMSSPITIFLARGAYLDLPVAFFTVLSLFLYLIALKSGKRKHYILASIATTVGILTKWFAILIWPVIFIYVLLSKRKEMKKLLLSFLLSFILLLPYVILASNLGILFIDFTAEKGAIVPYAEKHPQFTTIEGWLKYLEIFNSSYFVFPISLFLLFSFYLFFKEKGKYWKFLLIFILIFYLFLTVLPNKSKRFSFSLMLPFCSIMGYGTNKLMKRLKNKFVPILIGLLLFNVFATFYFGILPIYKKYNQEIANFVLSNPAPFYLASEEWLLYPSNIMFFLAKEGEFIKTIRPCAIQNNVNQTLYEGGVKWVIIEKDKESNVFEKMKNENLIKLRETIDGIEIYEYKFYNENPAENCNYVCLTEEKICTELRLD